MNRSANAEQPSPVMIYVTAGSQDEAVRIGRTLVAERLAACANVIAAVTSFYWWKGNLEESGEAALILKSQSDRVERIVARVKELHGYACPCVVALPIVAGNPAFLDWIRAETG